MLDWIFEGIVTWISSVMTSLMDAVSGLFLDALGTDMVVMEEYFPFVTKAFGILQYTAWALLFLITAWQLFRAFGGPITDAENPLTLVARSILFAVMIGYAQSIFQMTLDIARAPYTALMEVTMTAEDFTFAGIEEALKNGQGSIFLWLFCALAFLKCAQRFDSYLSSIGLNVAQTGSSMAMEMMMAARVLSGVGGGKAAGSVFRGSAAAGAAHTASTATGFASGFANRFKGNSYVRDAVVSGGTRMGAGGSVGFLGRAFGGIAARNGASLSGESIASVASRPAAVSGSIGGDIADRSLQNYMPQFAGRQLKNTQISGGRISTQSVGADGKQTSVEMFSTSQFDRPAGPHALVTASDGSQWYQVARGSDAGSFYDAPHFSGSADEAAQVASFFPDAPEGTMLRSVGQGEIEAISPDGTSSMWYNSAMFEEPDAPHFIMESANGVDWYAMQPHAEAPGFESESSPASSQPDMVNDFSAVESSSSVSSDGYSQPNVAGESVPAPENTGRTQIILILPLRLWTVKAQILPDIPILWEYRRMLLLIPQSLTLLFRIRARQATIPPVPMCLTLESNPSLVTRMSVWTFPRPVQECQAAMILV